jgi:hypothetical protein
MENGKWKMDTGLEALAGEGARPPAEASSPAFAGESGTSTG